MAHQRVCVGMKNGEFHVLAPFSFELLMKVLILPNSVINYKLEGAWLLLKKVKSFENFLLPSGIVIVTQHALTNYRNYVYVCQLNRSRS